jgi:hypothetical protein
MVVLVLKAENLVMAAKEEPAVVMELTLMVVKVEVPDQGQVMVIIPVVVAVVLLAVKNLEVTAVMVPMSAEDLRLVAKVVSVAL